MKQVIGMSSHNSGLQLISAAFLLRDYASIIISEASRKEEEASLWNENCTKLFCISSISSTVSKGPLRAGGGVSCTGAFVNSWIKFDVCRHNDWMLCWHTKSDRSVVLLLAKPHRIGQKTCQLGKNVYQGGWHDTRHLRFRRSIEWMQVLKKQQRNFYDTSRLVQNFLAKHSMCLKWRTKHGGAISLLLIFITSQEAVSSRWALHGSNLIFEAFLINKWKLLGKETTASADNQATHKYSDIATQSTSSDLVLFSKRLWPLEACRPFNIPF